MKVLITGATGQTASYLVEYILENHKNVEIHCTRRWRSREENISSFKNKVIWHNIELKDQFNTYSLIERIQPDKIFIFSASSYVRDSWLHPQEYISENTSHLLNVMNSVLMINHIDLNTLKVNLKYNPKIFVALSSEEYGKVEHGQKITEEFPLRPISPYGVSKVAADLLAYQYHQSYNMNVYRFRLFNNEQCKRGEIFVTANFVKQVAQMEINEIKPVLSVGNIKSVRDWSDCRDSVRAIWTGLEKCQPGEVYNICSETANTIEDLINKLKQLSKIDFEVKVDPTRIRPSDVDWLLGDCTKFKKITNWQPIFNFINDTVPEMLTYWRSRI